MTEIVSVTPGSPAAGKISPGETLVSINESPIGDVLDYQFHSYDPLLLLTTKTPDGQWKLTSVQKDAGEDLGLCFADALMDKPRACQNSCIFCFIDQLPKDLRETLYFKDDDVRLSLLTGNYVSLTNLSEAEVARIIRLKISPVNISVHATDPRVRTMMLGNLRAGRCMELMRQLGDAGITMNAQIVLCPEVNDGAVLSGTMAELKTLYPRLQSVSVVPVGLTRHREGLYPLLPVDQALARVTIDQVEEFAACCLAAHGTRLFYCGDELYLTAGLPLPEEEAYEDYPQLENGVGLMRSFDVEFREALAYLEHPAPPAPFSVATGMAASDFLQDLLATAAEKCAKIEGHVYAVENAFFGPLVSVAGLITGQDLRAQLLGRDLGTKLLIPKSMLRHGEGVFLDGMTIEELETALGVPVLPIAPDGESFLEAIFMDACS